MQTMLDTLEESCQGEQSPWESASTAIGHGAYEGFWASSGTVEIVVDDDRIADNPINEVDPSGLAAISAGEGDSLWNSLYPNGVPGVKAVYGPGAAKANVSQLQKEAEDIDGILSKTSTGQKTLKDLQTGKVRIFLTEKMSIWDRYRTRRQRRRGVWGPYIEEPDAQGGESLPVTVDGKQQWHIYIRSGSSAKSIAELLVHETVHTTQTPGLSIAKEVQAYTAEAQWNIEMSNFGAADIHQTSAGSYVVNDPTTIQNRLLNDPLYNWQDAYRRLLYDYESFPDLVPHVQQKMDFDSGTWAAELGGICSARSVTLKI
jgi:hypothetical protein